ncbi:hypothetical protein KQI84_06860 [bacterium]|nr:hypothetical protein [bacterium]
MNLTRAFALRWLAATLVAGSIFFFGCGDDSAPEEPEDVAAEISRRADEIIAASDASSMPETFEYPDGEEGVRYVPSPPNLNLPHGTWSPPTRDDQTTPGEIVHTFSMEGWPEDIAIDDQGTVLIGWDDSLRSYKVSSAEPEMLSDKGARSLQWHPDGNHLLVSGPWQNAMYEWPSGRKINDIEIAAPGLLQFAPDGKSLWSVKNVIGAEELLSAESEVRVSLQVDVYPFEGASTATKVMSTSAFAMIGTMPSIGMAWGHAAKAFQLDPWPAPLIELDENLIQESVLTRPTNSVDLDPHAGAPEFVYFIRARQRGGRSSRAWVTSVNDSNLERSLTAEPTYDIAISPDGRRVALLVLRDDQGVLLRTTREALFARDLTDALASREEFKKQSRKALEAVRGSFRRTEMGQTLKLGDFGWEVEWPPEEGLMFVMDEALRAALKRDVGLDLPDGFEALGQLDDFLAESDGIWPEEPATVVAVASLYGNVLNDESDVDWYLATSMPEMSYALRDFTVSDGLMYSLHSPFLVARERLQGRARLDATATDLLLHWERPIALVENFEESTLNGFLGGLAGEAGIPIGAKEDAIFESAALRAPQNDVAQMLARSVAQRFGDRTMEMVTSFNLAENNPANGRALVMAAQAAQRLLQDKAALRLYDQAAKLSPDDLDVMLAVAIGYFDENLFDEAEERFLQARRIDEIGLAHEIIDENLKQLRALRDAEKAEDESEVIP